MGNVPKLYGKLNYSVLNTGGGGGGLITQYVNKAAFPNIGVGSAIYIDMSENSVYRWDEINLNYYCIGRDYMEIEVINGGGASG